MQPLTSTREVTMHASAPASAQTAIHINLAAIFVSLELSRSTWLITSLSPGGGEKMSKHSVRSGDVAGLLDQLARLRAKAQARTGKNFPIIVIQEAGLDGFWIHRVLERESIESHVVDAASISRVAWISRKGALTPTPFWGHAMRTDSGRPSSNMRFRAWTATSTSITRRWSVRERSPSPITCLNLPLVASTRARMV
jgi:hypothetical protein